MANVHFCTSGPTVVVSIADLKSSVGWLPISSAEKPEWCPKCYKGSRIARAPPAESITKTALVPALTEEDKRHCWGMVSFLLSRRQEIDSV